LGVGTTFIHDPRQTFDFCHNPSLPKTHGALSYPDAKDSILRPIFRLSKLSTNPEFLITPLEGYDSAFSPIALKSYTPWDGKTENKLFWRGTATGDFYGKREGYDWRRTHRPALHFLAQNGEGVEEVWVETEKCWERETWKRRELNEKYLDVGLTGKPHQVSRPGPTWLQLPLAKE